ncbi:MAG: hypothetical protein ACOC56_05655 [Atribacterota bacterium]
MMTEEQLDKIIYDDFKEFYLHKKDDKHDYQTWVDSITKRLSKDKDIMSFFIKNYLEWINDELYDYCVLGECAFEFHNVIAGVLERYIEEMEDYLAKTLWEEIKTKQYKI